MSAGLRDDLISKRVRVFSLADGQTVMGEGEVIAICYSPSITLRHDDGTRSHHSADLPREIIEPEPAAAPASCSQCGQRTPLCAECDDSIIFVPKAGFGNTGEWRHLAPPHVGRSRHMARPKVFVS